MLLTVKRDQLAYEKARPMSEEEEAALTDPIREKYEVEGHPYYGSARLWDDGVIEPAETRDVLGLALAAARNAPDPAPRAPVYRM